MSEPVPNKEEETRYEFCMRLIRGVQAERLTDTPMNDLAFAYQQGHEAAIDAALNVIRREL